MQFPSRKPEDPSQLRTGIKSLLFPFYLHFIQHKQPFKFHFQDFTWISKEQDTPTHVEQRGINQEKIKLVFASQIWYEAVGIRKY
jgi:hypothetical protein